jgi:hypothetical protein
MSGAAGEQESGRGGNGESEELHRQSSLSGNDRGGGGHESNAEVGKRNEKVCGAHGDRGPDGIDTRVPNGEESGRNEGLRVVELPESEQRVRDEARGSDKQRIGQETSGG